MNPTVSHERPFRLYPNLALALLLGALPLATAAESVDERLQRNCMGCHAAGIAGAPAYLSHDDWAERIETTGWDQMVDNAMSGVGRMPPKGYCVACSREDLELLILRLVPDDLHPPEP